MISELEIVLRLGLSALMGMIIGFERERQNQPAGLRTHTILAIGSCLAMTISINLSMQYLPNSGGDPSRLAAQVVSGIGFLGAGAILRYGTSVKGLTTATSLWTMAIVGLAVGAGHYFAAVAATVALLFVLVLLNILEKKLIRVYTTVNLVVTAKKNPELVRSLQSALRELKKKVISTGIERNLENDTTIVTIVVKAIEDESFEDIQALVTEIPGVIQFKIN
ncbi:MAG: MgtC/SapB family protein [Anaerolineaceae bacterium]